MHIIKRYANRKLYEPALGSYISLKDIYSYLQAGQEIQVTDFSKKDITVKVLLSAVAQEAQKTITPEEIGTLVRAAEIRNKTLGGVKNVNIQA